MTDPVHLAPVYLQLRDAITRVVPGDHGIAPSADLPHLWGVMIDVGLPQGPVTLVAIADTTTSLYLGNGGATVGVGALPDIATAARELLRRVDASLAAFEPTWELPLPATGSVRFLALTYVGMAALPATIEALERPGHPLGPAWQQAGALVDLIGRLGPTPTTEDAPTTA